MVDRFAGMVFPKRRFFVLPAIRESCYTWITQVHTKFSVWNYKGRRLGYGGGIMKISAQLLILFMSVIFLCSCQRVTGSDSYASDFPEPHSDNQEEVKSIYQLNKPLMENDAFFEIEPLDLPS